MLPKPEFKECDETSLTLKTNLNLSDDILTGKYYIKLLYKQIHESWDNFKSVTIDINDNKNSKNNQIIEKSLAVSITAIDLNPGTPYMVRFGIFDDSNKIIELGPETVFDTAPVDCGPKKKKCIIS